MNIVIIFRDSSCKLTPAQCDSKKAGLLNWKDSITSPPKVSSNKCEFDFSTDYFGGDLTVVTGVEDHEGCCQQCLENGPCKYFTYNTESNVCYLKLSKSSIIKKDNLQHLISGTVLQK